MCAGKLFAVANGGAFAQNINDLVDEGTGKLVERRSLRICLVILVRQGDLSGHDGGGGLQSAPLHFSDVRR